jgi:hypothetical protein
MARPTWQYAVRSRIEINTQGKGDLAAGLNKLGEEGWELVAVEAGEYYFKRGAGLPRALGSAGGLGPARPLGIGTPGAAPSPAPTDMQVVRLKQADAVAMAKLVRDYFSAGDRRGAARSIPNVVADERTNTLIVGGTAEEISTVHRLIQALDVPGADRRQGKP